MDIKHMYSNGVSIVDIALKTGYSEKTIRKWLRSNQPPRYRRSRRPSNLDPYKDYIMGRMDDGVFNCEILLRELRDRGYEGGRTILKEFVAPFRSQFKLQAVRRFETDPGEQAQMDWSYLGQFYLDGRLRKVWWDLSPHFRTDQRAILRYGAGILFEEVFLHMCQCCPATDR